MVLGCRVRDTCLFVGFSVLGMHAVDVGTVAGSASSFTCNNLGKVSRHVFRLHMQAADMLAMPITEASATDLQEQPHMRHGKRFIFFFSCLFRLFFLVLLLSDLVR